MGWLLKIRIQVNRHNFCKTDIHNRISSLIYKALACTKNVNVGLFPCSIQHHAKKGIWTNEGIVPRILNLGIRWKRMIWFTSRQLYLRDPLNGRLDGPQSGLDVSGKRKKNKCLARVENHLRFLGSSGRSIVTMPTELPQLYSVIIVRPNSTIPYTCNFCKWNPLSSRMRVWQNDAIQSHKLDVKRLYFKQQAYLPYNRD